MYIQNILMLTNTADAPMMNASMSVKDVMVIAMPLFFNINAIRSSIVDEDIGGASAIPDKRINMSSIPMPKKYTHIYIYIYC